MVQTGHRKPFPVLRKVPVSTVYVGTKFITVVYHAVLVWNSAFTRECDASKISTATTDTVGCMVSRAGGDIGLVWLASL